MAALTAPVTPSENESDAEEMCPTDRPALRPTMWLRDPETGELRRVEPGERVWALHPVTGELVRVRTWKDVRDLERQARRAGDSWDQLIVVTDAGASTADVRSSLAGHGPWPAIATDEDSARGRLRLPVFGPTDPVVTVDPQDPVEWVQELAGDQKQLRQLGAGHVAHTLFGAKTRRDIVAGVGAAMLSRGPSGRLGNRHVVVAIAAAAADLLSADQIADLLNWPAPDDEFSGRSAQHLRTVLSLVPADRRLRFIEALAAPALDRTCHPHCTYANGHAHRRYNYGDGDGDGYRYYADDYDDDLQGMWDPDYADFANPLDLYLDSIHMQLRAVSATGLYVRRNGTVGRQPGGSLASRLALAAFASEQYLAQFGDTPRFTDDIELDALALLSQVFPALAREWEWDEQFLRALGRSVPGLPGSQILVPASPEVLAEWGVRMGNCIGSYENAINAGGVVGAVEMDGRIEVNFHLSRPHGTYLVVNQVAARFNQYVPHLVDPVIDHLRAVVGGLPAGLAPATPQPPRVPGPGGTGRTVEAAASCGESLWAWTVADELEAAADERFVRRRRRTAGGRRLRSRYDSQPAPLSVLRRIASDPLLSRTARGVTQSMDPELAAAVAFGMASERSLADVLAIAAAVAPALAWPAPRSVRPLRELVGEFDSLTPDELGRRWDRIAPFGHAPRVDDAVRSALVALLDGSLEQALVSALDRDAVSKR